MKTFKEVCGKRSRKEDVKSADKKPETYTKPDGKIGTRMVPVDKAVVKSEKVVGYKTDSKLPNLKVPINRKQGKIINPKNEDVNEEATFKVNIEGLPMMFMSGMGTGDVKAKLRAIVKQPKMIKDVERVTDAEVKKNFRLKAQGRDEEDQVDESSYDKINKYHDAANKSKDRATNSAVATILRKGDHSNDLNTMRKREKGIKLAKSRVTDKIRKGQKS